MWLPLTNEQMPMHFLDFASTDVTPDLSPANYVSANIWHIFHQKYLRQLCHNEKNISANSF